MAKVKFICELARGSIRMLPANSLAIRAARRTVNVKLRLKRKGIRDRTLKSGDTESSDEYSRASIHAISIFRRVASLTFMKIPARLTTGWEGDDAGDSETRPWI